MADWADWLLKQRAAGRSAWAYFNNDIGGDAIEDARTLKRFLAERGGEQLVEPADRLIPWGGATGPAGEPPPACLSVFTSVMEYRSCACPPYQ